MSIRVSCKCGKSFVAPEKLAGKKAKCPACQRVLEIYSVNVAAEQTQADTKSSIQAECRCGNRFVAPTKLAGKKVKCPQCGQPVSVPAEPAGGDSQVAENKDLGDLLDEVGISATKTGSRCPDCGSDLADEAIICVSCGLNVSSGKRLRTKTVGRISL